MSNQNPSDTTLYDEPVDRVEFQFEASFQATRRQFMQLLGAGLIITVADTVTENAALAQRPQGGQGGGRGGRGSAPIPLSARLHIGQDGNITILAGKVECGQGVRAQLTQAAAEELRLPVARIKIMLADTDLTPNDGITAGSRSTPSTVPAVRQAAAAARNLLIENAARSWNVPAAEILVREGQAVHEATKRTKDYAALSSDENSIQVLHQTVPENVSVVAVKEWQVLGSSLPRPNGVDIVTGAHQYPSDIARPGMLYGRVLRAPSYGAKLNVLDLNAAQQLKDVQAVRDGDFIGVVAPSSFQATKAIELLEKAAQWTEIESVSSEALYDHLRQKAEGGLPPNPFADDVAAAPKKRKQSYNVAYVQHAPMEPRAAVAEWNDGKVTVWTATQNPFGVRSELARAFRLDENRVRVIVPDFGGGFGGKHSGECAIEAARLAQAAKRPVHLRWTRQEEFTWAYFRPAAAIDAEASLDEKGTLTTWHFINVNAGGSAIETPYKVPKARSQSINSAPPLRHGSYRALAATANTFARECFMDELAELANQDPLVFRIAHLEEGRLRDVLEAVAKRFDWDKRRQQKAPNVGIGLGCGTEKGSFVAACALVEINTEKGAILVREICMSYECGAIMNPANLMTQVQGGIIMGLGPALREAMQFEKGRMLNATFGKYPVPRLADVPRLDVHLLNRPDLPSVGAGETPIIAVAPAIANAVYHATGQRIREMPIRLPVQLPVQLPAKA
ncbi:MAG TPA: molybdopterin cofactor-binding domain-containing protein [Abditibacteriaceae bacterium]|jgi:isoquinoline 1-oxidoreductase